jgi:hypothetical protein
MQIAWDQDSFYSLGVHNGVFYPQNSPGVAWNGLVSVVENGDDAPTALYIDGQKVLDRSVPSAFAGTISAYTYPDEFEVYDGNVNGVTSQTRQSFGLSFMDNRELHLVYNALAAPSENSYASVGESPTLTTFSWDLTTLPIDIPAGRPSSHLVIMVDYAQAEALVALQNIIYGDDVNDPSLPDPATILEIFESYVTLRITDNGDGTWTATGPDDVVYLTAGPDGYVQDVLDTFAGSSLDTSLWYESNGASGISVSGGKLLINAMNNYPMVEYNNPDFDMSSGILAAQLSESGTSDGTVSAFFGIQDEDGNAVYLQFDPTNTNDFDYSLTCWGDADLEDVDKVNAWNMPGWTAGTWLGLGNLTAGVIYWYSSPDGQTWTEIGHGSIVSGLDTTQCKIFFMCGLDTGTSTWTMQLDNPSKWQPGEVTSDEFTINWPSAIPIDTDSYRVFSL